MLVTETGVRLGVVLPKITTLPVLRCLCLFVVAHAKAPGAR